MLKKIKDWIGTNLDVYKVESANDVGAGLVRHIWKGEETATQVGTTLTAQIMNDLQKGLVHTLDTTRTVGTNKDIYEVTLTGIEEFGVFDGLKLLIRIDGENQFEDVFLKLGGTEYQIYQLKNNLLDKVDKGILKDKKEYLLNFKNNSFVLSDSTLYGSQKGTALEGNRLAEILGLEFGGNIQDIGNKTKGKFYYDSVTKYYYECIEDNSLTYNDTGKFRAISNKPIMDKLENLFEIETKTITIPNGTIKFTKTGKVVNAFVHLQNYKTLMSYNDNDLISSYPPNFAPNPNYFNNEFAIISSEKNNINGNTRLILRKDGVVIWGTSARQYYELKGSAVYCI
ncbi:hypothetical protein [Leptotrichia sp. oral taxon 847]|uniref:hypothetical protein n=1 Tax=Leptotrichia sp. oral taxon 847 TaxID=1785996 RepID=UPI000768307F|nr:hypothetical protein [Leptotrichia sp. oral taxon 847]AMD95675.1 hypothetical protein AXF11_08845 [Leptotrichia sp. oral taxon 847]